MKLSKNNLSFLFSNTDVPILVLKNAVIEYMNDVAINALGIQQQNYYQEDFFKFCLSAQIELGFPDQRLKNGDRFVTKNDKGIATLWQVQSLSSELAQNQLFMLLGSSLVENGNSSFGENLNQAEFESFDEFAKSIMGSGAKKYSTVKEHIENLSLYLDAIIYNMPGSVYWKDIHGVYLGGNQGVLDIVGFSSKEQLLGKTDYDIARANNWPISTVEPIIKLERQVIETKKPVKNIEDGPFNTKYDPAVYQLTNKVPLFDRDNNVIGILGISIDITELKKAQEREKEANAKQAQLQEEMQKAILTFTGILSHDLRTPLGTIQVITTLIDKSLATLLKAYHHLKEVYQDEEVSYLNNYQIEVLEESCRDIMEITKQANSYIDATLKIIKGAAGGSELLKPEDLVSCSIGEILRRVISDYPFREGEKEKLHFDATQYFKFKGNSIFMARILQNLIKNAFEQIRLKEKGEIFISCERGKSFNYLKFKDTAGGLTAALVEHLFEGFYSTKIGGTGLGLASAKRIMQAFGGDISCCLVEDDCIEFVLNFPHDSD